MWVLYACQNHPVSVAYCACQSLSYNKLYYSCQFSLLVMMLIFAVIFLELNFRYGQKALNFVTINRA